jgi:hypothetical protein
VKAVEYIGTFMHEENTGGKLPMKLVTYLQELRAIRASGAAVKETSPIGARRKQNPADLS